MSKTSTITEMMNHNALQAQETEAMNPLSS